MILFLTNYSLVAFEFIIHYNTSHEQCYPFKGGHTLTHQLKDHLWYPAQICQADVQRSKTLDEQARGR